MKAYFGTLTGSRYLVTDTHLTRLVEGEGSQPLRRDGEGLRVIDLRGGPKVRERFTLVLAGLGTAPYTIRSTSPVTWIRWVEP